MSQVNGGPFIRNVSIKDKCIGPAVKAGALIPGATFDAAPQFSMFGTNRDGNWIMGTVWNSSQLVSLGVSELITGFGRLVRNGEIVVAEVSTAKKAPRTIIGVDKTGRLFVLQVKLDIRYDFKPIFKLSCPASLFHCIAL